MKQTSPCFDALLSPRRFFKAVIRSIRLVKTVCVATLLGEYAAERLSNKLLEVSRNSYQVGNVKLTL
jgi:hypothetical protein